MQSIRIDISRSRQIWREIHDFVVMYMGNRAFFIVVEEVDEMFHGFFLRDFSTYSTMFFLVPYVTQ